jgi:predicted dehydrogenase
VPGRQEVHAGIDTDDVVQILLDFRDGPQVVLHSDMIQRPYGHEVKFFGEKGTLTWDLPQHRVNLYRAETKAGRSIRRTSTPAGGPR